MSYGLEFFEWIKGYKTSEQKVYLQFIHDGPKLKSIQLSINNAKNRLCVTDYNRMGGDKYELQ